MSGDDRTRDPADELARLMERRLSAEDRAALDGLRTRFSFGRGVLPEFAAAVSFDGAPGLLVATRTALQFADIGGIGDPVWMPMSNVSSVWAASTGDGVGIARRNGQSHVLTDIGEGVSANEVALTLRGLAERAREAGPGAGATPAGAPTARKARRSLTVGGTTIHGLTWGGVAGMIVLVAIVAVAYLGVDKLLNRPEHDEGDCVVLVQEAGGLSYGSDIQGTECTTSGFTPEGARIYRVAKRLNGSGRSCGQELASFDFELSHEPDDTTYCLVG